MGIDIAGVGAVADVVGGIIDRIWPNPAEREAAKIKLAELQQSGELQKISIEAGLMKAQADINLQDAKSEHFIQYGWRPFIGWMCGIAFAYNFVLQPFIVMFLSIFSIIVVIPSLDTASLMGITTTLLGLGYMRSGDKKRK